MLEWNHWISGFIHMDIVNLKSNQTMVDGAGYVIQFKTYAVRFIMDGKDCRFGMSPD
jgi:hypothetical protein